MRTLLSLTALLLLTGCSLHDQIESAAESWQGQPLALLEGAWGAPSEATDPQGWTTWTLGNDQGGWIVGFHTKPANHRIDDHTVTTWGTLPNDLPRELAPSHPAL